MCSWTLINGYKIQKYKIFLLSVIWINIKTLKKKKNELIANKKIRHGTSDMGHEHMTVLFIEMY